MKGKSDKLIKSTNIDLSRIPPCLRCLHPHIKRVNYRLAQWKQAHIPFVELPDPTEHGWETSESGILEPEWSDGPILPESLMDIIDTDKQSPIENEDYDCDDELDDDNDDIDEQDNNNTEFDEDDEDDEL